MRGRFSDSYALAHPERVARLVVLNSFAHFGSQARLWLGYHLLRATPWGMTMHILEGHGHSCLVAPDMDLSAILDEWTGRDDR